MNLVEVKNLVKSYGNRQVLKRISLFIPEGHIMALLGPNGAGKTTFLRCLLNLIPITSGHLSVHGNKHTDFSVRKLINYVPDRFSFFPYYTVGATLKFFAEMRETPAHKFNDLYDLALGHLNLGELENQKIKSLSKGQLQRVGLATLFFGEANLYLLDEPFSGLDPIGIKDLKELFLKFKSEGKTLFINSHQLTDMEKICDEVAILKEGQVLAQKSVKEILSLKPSLEDYFYHLVKGEKSL